MFFEINQKSILTWHTYLITQNLKSQKSSSEFALKASIKSEWVHSGKWNGDVGIHLVQKNRYRKMTHKRLRQKNENTNRLNLVSRSWWPLISLKRNLKYGPSLGGLLTDKWLLTHETLDVVLRMHMIGPFHHFVPLVMHHLACQH